MSATSTILMTADIERFFQFLDSPNEIFTYCFLDAESKNVIKGNGVKFGIVPEILQECNNAVTSGNRFTLHTTLNRTKLSGRKRKDIESVRCLCVDFDNEITEPEVVKALIITHKVHLVVESSPGKYHFYWKLDALITIPQWSAFQLGLAHYFNADLNLAEPHHTIRVPGVSRVCKNGAIFMPRIVYQAETIRPLTYDSVLTAFPNIFEQSKAALEKKKEKSRVIGKAVKQWKNGEAWAKASIEKAISASNRNDTLFSLIYAASASPTSDKSEGISYAAVCQLAQDFNTALVTHEKGALPEDELQKTVQSAYDSGVKKREEREARNQEKLDKMLGNSNSNGVNGEHVEPKSDKPDNREDKFSDIGLLHAVLKKYGGSLRRIGKTVFAFEAKAQLWRNQKGTYEIIHELIYDVAGDLCNDPDLIHERCTDDKGEISIAKIKREKDRLRSFRLVSQACTHLLNSSEIKRVTFAEFDNNPWLFYAKNGVVDLLNGTIRDAQASDMLLRQAPVIYDPSATCPYFENFISEVYAQNQNPAEVIRFIQELFGYSLTGDTEEQTIFIHVGDGANGKSRVLGALAALLGEYSTRLEPTTLTKNKNSIEKEVSRLGAKIEGKRLMVIDDLDTKTQWNDSLIKTLTDTALTARNLYEEERDIPNHAKIHIGCNQTPNIEHGGKAMDRRVCILEYPREFVPSPAKHKEIVGAINRELSGILNWSIVGLKRIQAYEDKKTLWPEEVYMRVGEYQEANAPVELPIETLFAAPESENDRHTLDEIMFYIKTRCSEIQEFSRDRVGRILRKNGFAQKRVHRPTGNIRYYLVKFKDENPIEKL